MLPAGVPRSTKPEPLFFEPPWVTSFETFQGFESANISELRSVRDPPITSREEKEGTTNSTGRHMCFFVLLVVPSFVCILCAVIVLVICGRTGCTVRRKAGLGAQWQYRGASSRPGRFA